MSSQDLIALEMEMDLKPGSTPLKYRNQISLSLKPLYERVEMAVNQPIALVKLEEANHHLEGVEEALMLQM